MDALISTEQSTSLPSHKVTEPEVMNLKAKSKDTSSPGSGSFCDFINRLKIWNPFKKAINTRQVSGASAPDPFISADYIRISVSQDVLEFFRACAGEVEKNKGSVEIYELAKDDPIRLIFLIGGLVCCGWRADGTRIPEYFHYRNAVAKFFLETVDGQVFPCKPKEAADWAELMKRISWEFKAQDSVLKEGLEEIHHRLFQELAKRP
ncbi:MAG: hypothetical protein LBI81_03440 [Puniceicoccales bacterium]|jgi:hypothetical protein|nr:hypothetical protein [Puniceicoccales bacterium]